MLYRNHDHGMLEIISSGSMFAGKTRTLLTRLETFVYAGRKVLLFFPQGSQERYNSTNKVIAHNGQQMHAIETGAPKDILMYLKQTKNIFPKTTVIGIDEIMLFDNSVVDVVETLVSQNYIVIGSGLSLLAEGTPFGPMPELLARADIITQTYGVCQQCGNPSTRTWPKFKKESKVVVGNEYIALCRQCWNQKNRRNCVESY